MPLKIGYFLDEYLVLKNHTTPKHPFWIKEFKYPYIVSEKSGGCENIQKNCDDILKICSKPSTFYRIEMHLRLLKFGNLLTRKFPEQLMNQTSAAHPRYTKP